MTGRRYTTLLFDLDGTLLDVHMPTFLEAYFRSLAPRFAPGVDPGELPELLMGAVRKMMSRHGGPRTTLEVFLDDFVPRTGKTREEVAAIFAAYYRKEFQDLRHLTRPFSGARDLVEKLVGRGYTVALATNPVFTRPAIEARVAWAGLEEVPFALVTSAEIMHACKPHREYFEETLALLGRTPAEALMIGNDPEKDLPSRRAGVDAFLLLPEGGPAPAGEEVGSGTMADLAARLGGPCRA